MSAANNKSPVQYGEKRLFLILIPCINILNYYLTYSNISFNSHTVFTFLLDTMEGYAAWLGLRWIIIYLDKKMPYTERPLKRIVVQLIGTSVTGLTIIILLTEFINRLNGTKPVPSSFYKYDLFIFLIWFLVVNGIYIGIYYYRVLQKVEQLRKEDKKLRQEGFMVNAGKQKRAVPFADIIGFYVEGEYSVVLTRELKKYLVDQSLDKIERSLPPEIFFRLNRQYILSRLALKGFKRADNGKLIALVNHPDFFPEDILVSRTKAPSFKQWFSPV